MLKKSCGVLVCALIASSPSVGFAATFTVTSVEDTVAADGACTLREAVNAANANVGTTDCPANGTPGDDEIRIPAGTIALTGMANENLNAGGDLDISPTGGSLNVTGAGRGMTIIDGGGLDRIFELREFTDRSLHSTLWIHDLTLRHGSANAGGAIYAAKEHLTLMVERVDILNSHAGQGGGIYANTGEASQVYNTSISGCTSTGSGSAIYSQSIILWLARSTVSGNTGNFAIDGTGQGVRIENSTLTANTGESGTVRTSGNPLTVTHSTIAGNMSGGVSADNSVTRLRNSIVTGNSGGDCAPGTNGSIISEGYNLLGGATNCGTLQATDVVSAAPHLGPLMVQGGATMTMMPLATSPALNRGICTDGGNAPIATDQRGVRRPQGGACDIGAVEVESIVTGTRVEPPGANCADGGARIESGIDDDGDGTLAPGEIDTTIFVCSGEDGDNVRIEITPETMGGACPFGGQRIDVGIDDDGDGILDPEEIDDSGVVCNGAPGADGKAACSAGGSSGPAPLLVALALAWPLRRRRRAATR